MWDATLLAPFSRFVPKVDLFMHYSHPFAPFGLSFGSLLVRFRILLAPFWYRLAHFCSPQGSIFSFWDLSASFLNSIILPTQILQKSKSFVQIGHSAVAETRPCRAKDCIRLSHVNGNSSIFTIMCHRPNELITFRAICHQTE